MADADEFTERAVWLDERGKTTDDPSKAVSGEITRKYPDGHSEVTLVELSPVRDRP